MSGSCVDGVLTTSVSYSLDSRGLIVSRRGCTALEKSSDTILAVSNSLCDSYWLLCTTRWAKVIEGSGYMPHISSLVSGTQPLANSPCICRWCKTFALLVVYKDSLTESCRQDGYFLFCISSFQRPLNCPFHDLQRQSLSTNHSSVANGDTSSSGGNTISQRGVAVAATVVLQSSDGAVLITQRAAHMRTYPLVWVVPGMVTVLAISCFTHVSLSFFFFLLLVMNMVIRHGGPTNDWCLWLVVSMI